LELDNAKLTSIAWMHIILGLLQCIWPSDYV